MWQKIPYKDFEEQVVPLQEETGSAYPQKSKNKGRLGWEHGAGLNRDNN